MSKYRIACLMPSLCWAAPAAAQREYSGDRYPPVDRQPTLRGEKYRYQPKNRVVRETYRAQGIRPAHEADRRDSKGAPPEMKPDSSGKMKHESREKKGHKNAHGNEGGGHDPGH